MVLEAFPSADSSPRQPRDEIQLAGVLEELIKQGTRVFRKPLKVYHGSDKSSLKLHPKDPLFTSESLKAADEYSVHNAGPAPTVFEMTLEPGRFADPTDMKRFGVIDEDGILTPRYADVLDRDGPAGALDYNWQDLAYSPEFRQFMKDLEIQYLFEPEGLFYNTLYPEMISLDPVSQVRNLRPVKK